MIWQAQFWHHCKSVMPILGSPRCSWAAVPRSLHCHMGWLEFLGVEVQEHLGYPRLGTTDVSEACSWPAHTPEWCGDSWHLKVSTWVDGVGPLVPRNSIMGWMNLAPSAAKFPIFLALYGDLLSYMVNQHCFWSKIYLFRNKTYKPRSVNVTHSILFGHEILLRLYLFSSSALITFPSPAATFTTDCLKPVKINFLLPLYFGCFRNKQGYERQDCDATVSTAI